MNVVIRLVENDVFWNAYYTDAISKQLDRTVGSFSEIYLQRILSKVESGKAVSNHASELMECFFNRQHSSKVGLAALPFTSVLAGS